MKPNQLVPREGGICCTDQLSFSASIELEPILLPSANLPGEFDEEIPEIELEEFILPSVEVSKLANSVLTSAVLSPDEQFEGSIFLQSEHHSIEFRELRFGDVINGEIEAEFILGFDLYFCEPSTFDHSLKLRVSIDF